MCGYDGIGRRSGFKIHRWQHLGSSNLPIRTTFFSLFFFFAVLVRADFINLPHPGFYLTKDSLAKKIQKFIYKNKIKPETLSIAIESQNPVKAFKLSYNGEKYFIPASLNKVFIALGALDEWGANKQFTSSLLVKKTSTITKNKVLKGDLFFNGGGDPAFVSESMWNLVRELSHLNISKIKGNLVIFKKIFPSFAKQVHQKNRGDRAYEALVSPSSFNWNSLTLRVRPSYLGSKARVIIDPYNSDMLEVQNNVQSVLGKSTNIKVKRLVKGRKNILILKGHIGLRAKEFVSYKNISSPELWLGSYLRIFLKKRGITLQGKIKIKNFKKINLAQYKKVVEVKSKSIVLLIADMLKFSNNYIADMLSLQFSKYRVKKVFQSIARVKESKHFKNASGLSRKNKLKAKTVVRLLKYIQNHKYGAELLSAFSIAGVDGTLKSYNFVKKNQVIRGKTGLLTGVVGFAGYLRLGKKENLLVTWIFNGKAKNTLKALRWRREFLQMLLQK